MNYQENVTDMVCSWHILPKELYDMQDNSEEYKKLMEQPYIESLSIEAESVGVKIGCVQRKDYGLVSAEEASSLTYYDYPQSYVTKFWAEVI